MPDAPAKIMCEATSYFIQMDYAEEAIEALYAAGYRIVHADEVPSNPLDLSVHPADSWHNGWLIGWNACRARVFRDG